MVWVQIFYILFTKNTLLVRLLQLTQTYMIDATHKWTKKKTLLFLRTCLLSFFERTHQCQPVLTVGLNGKGLYTLSVTRQTALLTHGKNF